MPTPFSHLAQAKRLLPRLPDDAQALIRAHLPAFYLGSVAADAKIEGQERATTHFYRYDAPMPDHPWRVMLERNPRLAQPADPAWRVFTAAYVAHLATDAHWSRAMLGPHFARAQWGKSASWRFYVLHYLLIVMDERDEALLDEADAATLAQCMALDGLPFMPGAVLSEWRDFIAEQIRGYSLTVPILAERVGVPAPQMRALLDDPAQMQAMLWDHVSPATLADVEQGMDAHACEQMLRYLDESAS
jgi:hypothetical protein